MDLYQELIDKKRDSYVIDKRHVRKDNSVVWGHLSVSLLHGKDDQPEYAVVSCEDLTGRKQAEVALHLTEEKYRLLVENTSEGVGMMDENGRIIFANRSMCEMFGYSVDELIGRTPFDFLDEKNSGIFQRYLDRRQKGQIKPYDLSFIRKDGRVLNTIISPQVVFDDQGSLLMSFALVTDITDRKRMEDELRESEEKYRKIFNNEIDAICIFEIESGRILDVNEAFLKLYGYTREEILKLTAADMSAEPDQTRAAIKKSASTGDARIPVRHHRKKDGTEFWVELSAGPFAWRGAKVMFSVIRDVNDQIKAKEELERQNIELRRLDDIKDGLIRDVSHELKTPVAKQIMHLEMLRSKLGEECVEKTGQILEVMESCVRRQESIIRNLLSIARLESDNIEFPVSPVRLDYIIQKVIDDNMIFLKEKDIEISVHIVPATVRGNEEMLWHVFENLIGNAIKFRAKGRASRIGVSLSQEEENTKVVVADNGIGLRIDHLAKVFDRFFQASASIEGSGIGLAFCREVLEKMEATISLESTGKDKGTTVTVLFPHKQDAS